METYPASAGLYFTASYAAPRCGGKAQPHDAEGIDRESFKPVHPHT